MARRKKGTTLAILGLILGLGLGFSKILIELTVESLLFDILDDEAKAACPCEFEADSIDFSLFTLSGEATNARIMMNGKPQLTVPRLTATFNPISHISNLRIALTSLNLIDAYSDDAGPDSGGFLFIEELARPLPPEKKKEVKLRVKLLRMDVINAKLQVPIGSSKLVAEGMGLTFIRDDKDNLKLTPSARTLKVVTPDGDSGFRIGRLQSSLYVTDDDISIETLSVSLKESYLKFKGLLETTGNEEVSGHAVTHLVANESPVEFWKEGAITGKATLFGKLEEPRVTAVIESLKEDPITLSTGERKYSPVELELGILYDGRTGAEKLLSLSPASMAFPGGSISSSEGISLSNGKLAGTIDLSFEELALPSVTLREADLTFNFSHREERNVVTLHGAIGGTEIGSLTLPPVDLEVLFDNEDLTYQLTHGPSDLGTLSAQGRVLHLFSQPTLKNTSFTADKLLLWNTGIDLDNGEEDLAYLSASGELSGTLDPPDLDGTAEILITSDNFRGESAIKGEVELDSEIISGTLQNGIGSLEVSLEGSLADDQESKLTVVLSDFQPKDYLPDAECAKTSLTADYRFAFNAALKGSGAIDISDLSLGCNPYETSLNGQQTVVIEEGNFLFNQLSLSSENSSLVVDGKLGGESLDIDVDGKLLLKSFLPLVPFFDDLAGELLLEASAKGTFEEPLLNGVISVRKGGVAIEAADIYAENIVGDLILSPDGVLLDSIHGEFNQGRGVITGTLDVTNFLQSDVTFEFEEILHHPDLDSYAQLSGVLSLARSERNRPLIRGQINIQNAEVLEEFDIRDTLSAIPAKLLRRTKEETPTDAPTSLPDIDLDLTIESKGNMFVITSFFGVEAEGSLRVQGNLNSPFMRGGFSTRRGWVGFNETRFEITSGEVTFRPPLLVPELALIAETYVRGKRGENALLILEADGPLLEPRIRITSDQGLSERETLALLGSRSDFRIGSARSTASSALELPRNRRRRDDIGLIRRVFREVTTIDSISFEPKFNAVRGQLEPALIAQKKLTPQLDILAESFLSSPEEGSQIFLRYRLNERTRLIGSLDTVTVQARTNVGADIAYTVLSRENNFVAYTFHGLKFMKPVAILDRQRLSPAAHLKEEDLQRLSDELENTYAEDGYLDAQVRAECPEVKETFCRQIVFYIDEGVQAKAISFTSNGDEIPEKATEALQEQLNDEPPATPELLKKWRRRIIRSLRSDGFLQARAQLEFEKVSADGAKRNISIHLTRGRAISLIFQGNEQFTSRELLETINLFEREQPFGNNTVHILARNIERLYREAGYLYATVNVKQKKQETAERTEYFIIIREEQEIPVDEVRIEGLTQISLDDLESQFKESGREDAFDAIFSPDFAVSEQIEVNRRQIKEMLELLGFANAEIESAIIPDDTEENALITYVVTEGERLYADTLKLVDLPVGVESPIPPTAPYSIPKANKYIEQILVALEEGGYLQGALWTSFEPGELTLHIEPGPRETVAELQILGTVEIPDSVVLEGIALKEGAYWTRENVRKTRARLLGKGLFSRVDIERESLGNNRSKVVLTVLERPLQTLELGGGLNSEFGLHMFGEAIERELFLDGRTLSLRFDTYYNDTDAEISRGLAGLRYLNPSFSQYDLVHTHDLRFEKLDLATQEFDLDRISFSSAVAKSFEEYSFSLGHTIFGEDLDDVTPDAVLDPDLDTGFVRLSILGLRASYDRRDDPLNPESGYNLGTELRLSSRSIGSDADYFTAIGRASYLYPFELRNTRFGFATGVRGGASIPYGDTDNIPISQRFYLGGRTTVRGFRELTLGPRGENGAVIGGDIVIALNNELRYFPTDTFSLHSFLDSGTVYLQDETISGDDVRHSAGFGARYISPIGPIGFDLGFPLDEKEGEPSVRLHFSIGSLF